MVSDSGSSFVFCNFTVMQHDKVNSKFDVFRRLLTLFGLGFYQPKKKVQLIFIKLMLFSMEVFVVSFEIKRLKTGHSLLPN